MRNGALYEQNPQLSCLNIATPKQLKGIVHSIRYGYKPKKSEVVHRLWELADSEEAIISLSDCLFVYLSGEERMEETLNRASTQYLVESKAPAQAVQSN